MLIHALCDEALRFYERYGFIASGTEPYTLMAMLADLREVFGRRMVGGTT